MVVLAALLLCAGCSTPGGDDDAPATTEPAATTATAPAMADDPAVDDADLAQPDDTAQTSAAAIAALPVEQLAGELVMTKLAGPVASADELDAISSGQVGSVILFGWNVQDRDQLRALVRSLDTARAAFAKRSGLPSGMLVSVDQEGGSIRNVPFAPPEHTQPALAAGSVDAAGEEARRAGEVLSDAGVSMDLGPVSDLASGPNRTMAGRSFGSDPATVARYVGATVRGLQQGGVAAVAKHFPGFGASSANSDEAVAYVDRSLAQLRAQELVPFQAAVEAGVDAIMVSHGIHRELGSTLPGTLDERIATGLLRDELHFDGVAMTDSMNARGLREAWGDTVPRACPKAVAAGIDLVLLTGTMETARLCRARIIHAVRDGELTIERVREAARRVEQLRHERAAAFVV